MSYDTSLEYNSYNLPGAIMLICCFIIYINTSIIFKEISDDSRKIYFETKEQEDRVNNRVQELSARVE